MLKVRDIMSTEVLMLDPELGLRPAVEALTARHVSGASVVAGGHIVGVVSASDLLDFADAGADTTERFADIETPEWDLLGEHVVAEAMTRRLCTTRPDAAVAEAARYMMRAGVHRLLVLDGKRLAGIVTATDIVRAVAEGRLVSPPAKR